LGVGGKSDRRPATKGNKKCQEVTPDTTAKSMLLVSIVLLSASYSIGSLAQSDSLLLYPVKNLILPTVRAGVLKETGGYAFNYIIGNGHGALQSIHEIIVELKAPVKPSPTPQDWTLWNMDYDTIQVAIWFSADSAADIDAGEVIGGYSLESGGLPRISRCWLSALEMVEGKEGQYDPTTASIFTTSLQRTTVGPANPPSPLVPLIFLDTLLSYTRQSADLGWGDCGMTIATTMNDPITASSRISNSDSRKPNESSQNATPSRHAKNWKSLPRKLSGSGSGAKKRRKSMEETGGKNEIRSS
jgi:hypothetical protein